MIERRLAFAFLAMTMLIPILRAGKRELVRFRVLGFHCQEN